MSDHETYRELGQDTTMEVASKVTSEPYIKKVG